MTEKTKRQNFSKATKRAADKRSQGRCEGECGKTFAEGDYREYHHIVECFYGGTNKLDNCLVLCQPCHDTITKRRSRDMAQTRRFERVARGEPKRARKSRKLPARKMTNTASKIPSRPMPGTKASGIKIPLSRRSKPCPRHPDA